MSSNLVAEVLGAMITPAVLISAGGTLVLSTSNRLSRVVDRVRTLAADADRLEPADGPPSVRSQREAQKRVLLSSQLRDLWKRAILLRSAIAALYVAIGLLIGVGIFTAFGFDYSFIPITLGMLGTGGLLWATGLLVREARLAIASTLEEVEYAGAVLRRGAGE
jgi:hypothetical protein